VRALKSGLFSFISATLLLFLAVGFASGATEDKAVVYLDNAIGSDGNDGSSPSPAGENVGPVASISRACDLLQESGKLIIKNTGRPYRGSLILVGKGGTPEQPLIIEGNHATLEGLEAAKPSDWKVEQDRIISMEFSGAGIGFFVVRDGIPPIWAKSLKDIQPGENFHDKAANRGYYCLPEGKSLQDLKLEVPTGGCGCGVEIIGASNIIIRNLQCRYFCNDGFNFQGECEGLLLEHIEGYLNGDQGFSCHATVSCVVVDGNFHNNDSGIADTAFSRSSFYGVLVSANRSYGVLFEGGEHSIVNGTITNNPISITLEGAKGVDSLPGTPFNPYANCRLCLRNTCVEGGDFGLKIKEGSRASVNYCVFRDQPTNLILADDQARLHMLNSIVAPRAGGKVLDCSSSQTYWGDYNCWASHSAAMNHQVVDISDIGAHSEIEAHSLVADPLFASNRGPQIQANSPARGKAYVDPTYYPWLKSSGVIDPEYPPDKFPLMYPDLYPDMGCVVLH